MDKKEAAKIFGENLRKIRTEKGMSQAELASKLGYNSRSSINKIEIGDRDMPRSKIVQMARILDVSKALKPLKIKTLCWCGWWDLNPHS